MTEVRWGVIGACGIAKRQTIPNGIIGSRNGRLVAVMDVDEEALRSLQREEWFPGGISAYKEAEDLYADPYIDAVYIANPNDRHCDDVCRAARAGKHVLCEKPLASTVEDAEEMVKVCLCNGVKFGIGLPFRFHSYLIALRKMIHRQQLGELSLARTQLVCWHPPGEKAWRHRIKQSGGGASIDMGIHGIDILEWLLGRITAVASFQNKVVHRASEVEDVAVTVLYFNNSALGVIDNSFAVPHGAGMNDVEVFGSKGSVFLQGVVTQSPTGRMIVNSPQFGGDQDAVVTTERTFPIPNLYRKEIEYFGDWVNGEENDFPTGKHGLHLQKILSSVYESARTGRTVYIE